jgi:tRNA (guanosine-2'-O-)-methyltransferase
MGSTDLKRLHRDWRRRTPGRVALLLDDVQGPFNVGALLRTAAAWRVDPVWLTERSARPRDPKTQKTALGSERFVDTRVVVDGSAAVAAARAEGFRVVAVELATGARPLHELDLTGDVGLVLGHEDRGVTPAVLAASDAVGFLPQLGRVGSLNVATAGAVAIYEVRRRAWTESDGGSPPDLL